MSVHVELEYDYLPSCYVRTPPESHCAQYTVKQTRLCMPFFNGRLTIFQDNQSGHLDLGVYL